MFKIIIIILAFVGVGCADSRPTLEINEYIPAWKQKIDVNYSKTHLKNILRDTTFEIDANKDGEIDYCWFLGELEMPDPNKLIIDLKGKQISYYDILVLSHTLIVG
ncbi:MAG: hypothetical protein JEZ07_16440 [Phycisphaerae bacterium]|nr:hypothetical protein [Phycisphaerae bacterium]